ncbi:helix-turn-helix domain-containing protein [Novosphingobium sp. G106]|uniref:helix-turn-helix domain-containing protein n=1 Tax=Novosphingobium sp. G106 TaxID=2849500 RepID=UPI001C2DC3B3|nr:helix-turn-helix domain-containing protein [Novosphingobium sp. G106]MBV1686464.1 helix-turn-helix domain-containing protein [Novosphingobium sp. G106]
MAKRVVEVMTYFSQGRDEASVMEIVRRYKWPQSSTSELLTTLVDLGILYKLTDSRRYRASPRLAALGYGVDAEATNGRLFSYINDLARIHKFGVGLFGMSGVDVQVLHWRHSTEIEDCNLNRPPLLTSTVVGQLLLSTLSETRLTGLLWRTQSEARPEEKFDSGVVRNRIAYFGSKGWSSGLSCFSANIEISAILLPENLGQTRMALGIFYPRTAQVESQLLVAAVKRDIEAMIPVNGSFIERPDETASALTAIATAP